MQRPDITIIGAGIFGLSAAWFCAQRGMRVRLVEKRRIGDGASSGLIGALSPHMPENWNAKKAFQLDALINADAFWRQIQTCSNLPTGYGRIGRLMPLHSENAAIRASARAQQAQTLWPKEMQWKLVQSHDALVETPFGFVHETLSARINPKAALLSLAAACRKSGVVIEENTVIGAFDGPTLIASGHEAAPHLPAGFLTGVKGQSALLQLHRPDLPILFSDGIYVVNQGAAGIAVGSTSEKNWSDPITTDELLDEVIEKAKALFPPLKDAAVISLWAGIRPRAKLPDPAIGQLDRNTFIATGGFKIGLALGPEIGRHLADHFDGKDLNLPPSFALTHQLER